MKYLPDRSIHSSKVVRNLQIFPVLHVEYAPVPTPSFSMCAAARQIILRSFDINNLYFCHNTRWKRHPLPIIIMTGVARSDCNCIARYRAALDALNASRDSAHARSGTCTLTGLTLTSTLTLIRSLFRLAFSNLAMLRQADARNAIFTARPNWAPPKMGRNQVFSFLAWPGNHAHHHQHLTCT